MAIDGNGSNNGATPVDNRVLRSENVPRWLLRLYAEIQQRSYTGTVLLHVSQGRVNRIERRTVNNVDDFD
jgi:hypothetical protein